MQTEKSCIAYEWHAGTQTPVLKGWCDRNLIPNRPFTRHRRIQRRRRALINAEFQNSPLEIGSCPINHDCSDKIVARGTNHCGGVGKPDVFRDDIPDFSVIGITRIFRSQTESSNYGFLTHNICSSTLDLQVLFTTP